VSIARHLRGAIALALLLAAPAATCLSGDDRFKFNLGVLRRDGVLLPFVSFDGHAWGIQWPDAFAQVPLPISLADVPSKWFGPPGPAAPWTAWFPDGPTRKLAIGKPVHVGVFCSGHLGLTTDYAGGEIDPRAPTVPKDALAVTGNVEVAPIITVSLLTADAARVVKEFTDRFNDSEKMAASAFASWTHPWSAEERKAFPIELEAFYRAPESRPGGTDFRTTYVEMVRRFPARPGDNGCGLITYGRGWMTEVTGKKPVITLAARVTYCDRDQVAFMQPLGRLRINKDSYWVYQMSSWRDETYFVTRVSQDGVRPIVAVSGGSCPREPRH
jgi:hypothetical protein